jgi:transcriptional regulator with XRE-family HTH domain
MKATNFDDVLAKRLKDKKFKKEFDALEAKEIIQLRQKAGMTQNELARQAHTSQAAISRLESGTYRNVSLSFLRRVGAVLGVKPHVKFFPQV